MWRRQSKVSSQLLMLVAQKPPRRQRAGAGVLLASRAPTALAARSDGYGLKITMSTRTKCHADTNRFSHGARRLWGTFRRSAIS